MISSGKKGQAKELGFVRDTFEKVCRLDTLAMVKVWEELRRAAG